MITLKGKCNHCGLCCFSKDRSLKCENLGFGAGAIGLPNAYYCKVYDRRIDNMPINMIDKDGTSYGGYVCAKDSQRETFVILERGIGKGCSLEVLNGG